MKRHQIILIFAAVVLLLCINAFRIGYVGKVEITQCYTTSPEIADLEGFLLYAHSNDGITSYRFTNGEGDNGYYLWFNVGYIPQDMEITHTVDLKIKWDKENNTDIRSNSSFFPLFKITFPPKAYIEDLLLYENETRIGLYSYNDYLVNKSM